MRVLVCGGRDYDDESRLRRILSSLHAQAEITLLIEGGARGADRLASFWACDHDVPTDRYEADWNAHPKAAGPIRNQLMLDEGEPDLVVAFPGGRGTADMVRRAKKAGVTVVDIPADVGSM